MAEVRAHAPSWSAVTRSARATQSLARRIGAAAAPGTVLALVGELGAGKTAFVQGLATGLGLDPVQVTSPTYALVHEYLGGRVPLVHIDLYRLSSEADARALGIEEQLQRRDAVVAIEWADRLPALVPERAAWLRFERQGDRGRRLTVTGFARPSE